MAAAGARLQRQEEQRAAIQEKADRLAAELADASVAVETGQARIASLGHDIVDIKARASGPAQGQVRRRTPRQAGAAR